MNGGHKTGAQPENAVDLKDDEIIDLTQVIEEAKEDDIIDLTNVLGGPEKEAEAPAAENDLLLDEDEDIIELDEEISDGDDDDESEEDIIDLDEQVFEEDSEEAEEDIIDLTEVDLASENATEASPENAENNSVDRNTSEVDDDDDDQALLLDQEEADADLEKAVPSPIAPPADAPVFTEEQLEAALERTIRKLYAEKIEQLMIETVKKTVNQEIEKIKRALLESDDDMLD